MYICTCRTLVWDRLKVFCRRLLNPDISQGPRDLYIIMLFFDVLTFVTIILGYAQFGVSVCISLLPLFPPAIDSPDHATEHQITEQYAVQIAETDIQ